VEIGSVSKIRLRPNLSEGRLKPIAESHQCTPGDHRIDESQLKSRGAAGAALKREELDNLPLENFSEASSVIRELTDYLQRNPSAIVRGKYLSQANQ
jgi:hypothetical protein